MVIVSELVLTFSTHHYKIMGVKTTSPLLLLNTPRVEAINPEMKHSKPLILLLKRHLLIEAQDKAAEDHKPSKAIVSLCSHFCSLFPLHKYRQ